MIVFGALTRLHVHYINIRNDLLSTRVLFRNPPVPKLSQLPLLWEYQKSHPHRFVAHVRVLPDTFDKIVDLIEDYYLFHNDSQNKQMPVRDQLAISLYRFGHYGNAAMIVHVAEWAGISEGSVINCTRRVSLALLSFHDFAMAWPDDDMRERAKVFVEQKVGHHEWRGGCFSCDGSPGHFHEKPALHGETWYGKSCRYSTNMQVRICFVCTQDIRKLRSFSTDRGHGP